MTVIRLAVDGGGVENNSLMTTWAFAILIGFSPAQPADCDRAIDRELRATAADRADSAARDRLKFAVRRSLRFHRHRDADAVEWSRGLTLSRALDIFEDVVGRVRHAYPDATAVAWPRLLGNGRDEIAAAFADPVFAHTHGITGEPAVPRWKTSGDGDPADLRGLVRSYAVNLSESANVPAAVVVWELACGVVHGLDEFCELRPPAFDEATNDNEPSVILVPSPELDRDGVKLLRVREFHTDTPNQFDRFIDSRGDARGLILDLRGNPGGSVTAALRVADRLLGRALLAESRGRAAGAERVFFGKVAAPCRLPVAVLIDGHTASAAEMVAAALQDHRRAAVIGTASRGKSSVQMTYPLTGGGSIRLTVARLCPPGGRSWECVGVRPNFIETEPIRQLERARAWLVNRP